MKNHNKKRAELQRKRYKTSVISLFITVFLAQVALFFNNPDGVLSNIPALAVIIFAAFCILAFGFLAGHGISNAVYSRNPDAAIFKSELMAGVRRAFAWLFITAVNLAAFLYTLLFFQ